MKITPQITELNPPLKKERKERGERKSPLDRTFEWAGFIVHASGSVVTTTWFARLICNIGVKENQFIKVSRNRFKIIKDGN